MDRATLREIKLLQELSHPNVIELLNVVGHRLSISLVFPLLSTDLEIVINERSLVFTLANVKVRQTDTQTHSITSRSQCSLSYPGIPCPNAAWR